MGRLFGGLFVGVHGELREPLRRVPLSLQAKHVSLSAGRRRRPAVTFRGQIEGNSARLHVEFRPCGVGPEAAHDGVEGDIEAVEIRRRPSADVPGIRVLRVELDRAAEVGERRLFVVELELAKTAEVPRRVKIRVEGTRPGERWKRSVVISAHHSNRSKIAPELRSAGLGRHRLLVGRLGIVQPAGAHGGFRLGSQVACSASLSGAGWNSPKACLYRQASERH